MYSLDRAVVARYFAFLVISQLVIFTLIGVFFSKSSVNDTFSPKSEKKTIPVAAEQVINEIGEHVSFQGVIDGLSCKDSLIS